MRPGAFFFLAVLLASGAARAQFAEHCTNDRDDDGDRLADCGDPDCLGHPSCPADRASESTPRACRNRADDDGDNLVDCDDPGCGQHVFCVGRRPTTESTPALCTNQRDDDQDHRTDCADPGCLPLDVCADADPFERQPEPTMVETHDPRRYPRLHVQQPMTYLSGMFVPELDFAGMDDVSIGDTRVHLGLGVTYGILDFWQVTIVPLPVQLTPDAQYEHPAIGTTLRVLAHEVVEVGIDANVAIPLTQLTERRERVPLAHLLARSRANDVAQLDASVLLRLHALEVARIDLTPTAIVVFVEPDVRVDLSFPLRVAFMLPGVEQRTGNVVVSPVYTGVESGVFLPGDDYRQPEIPLFFFAGISVPGSPRGPVVDARLRFGWPSFWSRSSDVRADGWQLTIEARVLTYLLP